MTLHHPFPFIPLNEYESILERTWSPENWRAYRHMRNPWGDPLIDRFQLLRFNLLRAIALRDDTMRAAFWANYGWLRDSIIEVEREALLDRHDAIRAAELEYIRETYLAAELATDFPIPKANQASHALPEPYDGEAIFHYDGMSALLPVNDPIRVAYNTSMRDLFHFRTEPDLSLGGISFAIQSSANHLLWELAKLSKESNALSGAGSKTRALFVNQHIPLPNQYTWLAWANVCCLAFSELSTPEKMRLSRMCGFVPHHILTFIFPCMPMTREHRSGGQLMGEDSHSDHSLSGRSSAHSRTPYGRIEHGKWECITVLLADSAVASESGPTFHLVAQERIKDGFTSAKSITARHANMLPGFKSTQARWGGLSQHNYDNFLPGGSRRQLWALKGFVNDPALTYVEPLSFHWAIADSDRPFDTGFRSLAKFQSTHFRFDDDAEGGDAAAAWGMAFIDCAIRWLGRSDVDHSRLFFESSLARQDAMEINATGMTTKRGPKARTDFGLSNLF